MLLPASAYPSTEQVSALAHLHRHGIVHMDLHPRNIIIDVHGHCRIAHFDVATQAGDPRLPSISMPESIYTPPELRQREGHEASFAVDMWGLGVLLAELVVGQVRRVLAPMELLLTVLQLRAEVLADGDKMKSALQAAAATWTFTELVLEVRCMGTRSLVVYL